MTDSVAYYKAAKAFSERFTYAVFPTHWPPLYPFLLSFFISEDGITAVSLRWVHTTLLALNVITFTWLLYQVNPRANWVMASLAGLFLLGSDMLMPFHAFVLVLFHRFPK